MSKINCPYCGSVQVKAMSNQPKKYPRPSDPIALQNWQRGFDCKKCGNDFVLQPPKPKKPLGFFGKLIKYSFILIAAFIAISIAISSGKDSDKKDTTNPVKDKPDSIEKLIKETETSNLKYNKGDPTPVAIEPNPAQSIKSSNNQSDTLIIETNIIGSN